MLCITYSSRGAPYRTTTVWKKRQDSRKYTQDLISRDNWKKREIYRWNGYNRNFEWISWTWIVIPYSSVCFSLSVDWCQEAKIQQCWLWQHNQKQNKATPSVSHTLKSSPRWERASSFPPAQSQRGGRGLIPCLWSPLPTFFSQVWFK